MTEKRTKRLGSTSTKGFTFALTKRFICGRSGSLETRRMDLEMGPEKLLVSTLEMTLPSPPGLMTLSKEATVHPQEGRASEMTRSEPPLFLMTKVASITWPLAIVPTSLVSGTTSIFGRGHDRGLGGRALRGGLLGLCRGRRGDESRRKGDPKARKSSDLTHSDSLLFELTYSMVDSEKLCAPGAIPENAEIGRFRPENRGKTMAGPRNISTWCRSAGRHGPARCPAPGGRTPRDGQRRALYPPMSTLLEPLRIPVATGFSPRTTSRPTATPSSSATPPCGTTSKPPRPTAGGCLSSRCHRRSGEYLLPGKTSGRRDGDAREDHDLRADRPGCCSIRAATRDSSSAAR